MAPVPTTPQRMNGRGWWTGSAWGFFFVVTLGPFCFLMSEALAHLLTADPVAWDLLLPSDRQIRLLVKSAGQSAVAASISTVIGALIAWAGLRLFMLGLLPRIMRTFSIALLIIWAIIPPYLHALASMKVAIWLDSFVAGGYLPGLPSLPSLPSLPGYMTISLIQAFALLPLPVAAALVGYLSIDRSMLEAALIDAPAHLIFERVIVPLMAPVGLIGGGLVFLMALLDSTTPSLYGVPAFATEIVAEFSASHQAWRAGLLALPLLAVSCLTLGSVVVACGTFVSFEETNLKSMPTAHLTGRWRGAAILALILGCGYGLVLVVVPITAGSDLSQIPSLIREVRHDLVWTLVNCLLAAALVLIPAFLVALSLVRMKAGSALRPLMWILLLMPVAIPPALTGTGIAGLMTAHGPNALRLSELLPTLGYIARFLPLATLLIYAQLRRIEPDVIDAAHLDAGDSPSRWLDVEVPIITAGLVLAFSFVFSASLGELETSLMTAAPGGGVLSLRIYNYLHYGASDIVARLGLILALLVTLAVTLPYVLLVARGKRNTGPPAQGS